VGSDDERALCVRYSNRIRSYGLCHLRDGTAAEELVQQVLLVVIEALRGGHVKDRANLESYVFGTCRNMVHDMRRGSARQRRIAEETAAVTLPQGYEPPMAVLDRSRLDSCLEGLEERARAVVLATFVDERDANEVGRAMGLSPGNVRVIRHRALAQLQKCMEGGAQA
jgi:RNA polymerase sigma-70 factor (ECF subfamily)